MENQGTGTALWHLSTNLCHCEKQLKQLPRLRHMASVTLIPFSGKSQTLSPEGLWVHLFITKWLQVSMCVGIRRGGLQIRCPGLPSSPGKSKVEAVWVGGRLSASHCWCDLKEPAFLYLFIHLTNEHLLCARYHTEWLGIRIKTHMGAALRDLTVPRGEHDTHSEV